MFPRPWLLCAVAALAGTLPAERVQANCSLGKLAELPVTMIGMKPMVSARINGQEALFVADSGAFYSHLTPEAAAEYKLRLEPAPGHLHVRGLNGRVEMSVTTVRDFTLANIPIPHLEFLVGGADIPAGVGTLGQNIFRAGDVEYDLAQGAIRIMRPHECKKAMLAYWADANQAVSVMDIDWADARHPHTTGVAYLNGIRIDVMFDTGAATSMLSLRAAERTGFKPDGPGVTAGGWSFGIGRASIKTWVAPFASFKIGEEEIRNTRLRVGEMSLPEADMLIGADFFLSHRVYVASSQRKLYFTYNGGPVFDLKPTLKTADSDAKAAGADQPAAAGAPEPTGAAAGAIANPAVSATAGGATATTANSPAATALTALTGSNTGDTDSAPPAPAEPGPAPSWKESDPQPTDAAGFSRRGAAYTARRDYQHAIADLTRACELAPSEPKYFYQRGVAHWNNRQPFLAMGDFDQTLKLKPDDLPALLARAQLRVDGHDGTGAIADLDAADHLAPKQADVHLRVGQLYERMDQHQKAIAQFDTWIDSHREDPRMADGLQARCWARAVSNQDLHKALSDCNRALSRRPDAPHILLSRGLVRLRMGDFDKAITDFSATLGQQPKNAFALYARGLAESRKGETGPGQTDMAAAIALRSVIGDEFKARGLAP